MRKHLLATCAAAAAMLCGVGSLVSAQVTVKTSGGEVVQLTQKNLVDHLIIGDSLEVEAAKLAVARTQNAAVKDFANTLITDHTNHLENLNKLAGKRDIGREANAADTSNAMAIRILTTMRDMPADSGFDRAFVRQQIRHHMHEIDALKMLRPAAKDDDLQHDIDRTMPVLERHLSLARQVGAQIGVTADSMPMKMPMTKPPTR